MINLSDMKTISIIIPVFYNALNLPDTVPRLLALADHFDRYHLELAFVDDGSGDQSLQILLDQQSQHPNEITIVKLTRNFGAMAAVQAGLSVVRGDCVGVIAADLQDPPELLVEMVEHWEKGTKAVFAVRADREEPFIQKQFSNLYYALMRRFAVSNYPEGGSDFLLIDRQVVDEINNIREKNTNLPTLIFWLGFPAMFIPYTRQRRAKGKSRWSFSKKIKLFIDSFVSFSYFPIRLLSAVGVLYALASFLYGCLIFYSWIRFGVEVRGWIPTMLLLSFTAGLQMVLLGVLGEYLWRTLDEARRRPPYVIDDIYRSIDVDSIDVNSN